MYNYVMTSEELLRYSQQLFNLIELGELTVRIHEEYPFTTEGVRAAHRDLESGNTIGKLILSIQHSVS